MLSAMKTFVPQDVKAGQKRGTSADEQKAETTQEAKWSIDHLLNDY